MSAFAILAVLIALAACDRSNDAPTPPKAVRALTSSTVSGIAGQPVSGGISVQVVDYSDRGVADVKVAFAVVEGDGSVASRLVLTDREGIAHTEWTLGQTAGENGVLASVFGIAADSNASFVMTGVAGAPAALAMTPRILRIPATDAGGSITARVQDQYGNATTGTPSYISRDPSMVTVSSTGQVAVVNNNRGGSTWVVGTGLGFSDSTRVFNLAASDPPCTGITALAALSVGEVKTTGFFDNGICVPAASGEREYALIPFFDSPVSAAQTVLTVSGSGVKATQSISLGAVRAGGRGTSGAIDRRLRNTERREMAIRATDARRWFSDRPKASGKRATLATTTLKAGDQLQLNVDDVGFCGSPKLRTGRVVAVTERAVVIADLANPAGYTDADYASFGVTFDTLAYPLDVANFGAPTDVDDNGRVLILFTHAVNELSPGILGYTYTRDILPKSGPLGSCPGSNVAEMLYIRVPDGLLTVANAKLDVVATLVHEFQHAINGGRRLYVNQNGSPTEEVWLNEGLSHIAEELAFYRASGSGPRQNLGSQLSAVPSVFREYAFQNFQRYFDYTASPGSQGLTDDDDDGATRGAAWSFLRFAADQRAAANETALWQGLVNSNSSGMQNLYDHLGADARLLIRDWAISNFTDDLVPTDAKYSQPSWNLRQVPGFRSPGVVNLVAQATPPASAATVTLRALSSEFVRFAVGSNQEAYISAAGFPASANTPLPRHVLLAIVRTK